MSSYVLLVACRVDDYDLVDDSYRNHVYEHLDLSLDETLI